MKHSFFCTVALSMFCMANLSSCSSEDEPKPVVDDNQNEIQYVKTDEFQTKVTDKVWVTDDVKCATSDGTVYDTLIYSFLVGDSGFNFGAVYFDNDELIVFWHPNVYYPWLDYNSKQTCKYTYDETTGMLTASERTFPNHQSQMRLAYVDDEKIVIHKDFGVLPVNYDGISVENFSDEIDEGSHNIVTMRLATAEETTDFFSNYIEAQYPSSK